MNSEQVLLISGANCTPDKEREFNEWYNSTFPPAMMKMPGVERIDRYERVEDDDGLPRFLSVVQFENMQAVDKLAESEVVKELGKIYIEASTKFDIDFRWAIRYKNIYSSVVKEL